MSRFLLLAALFVSLLQLVACEGGTIPGNEGEPPGAPTLGIAPPEPVTTDDLVLSVLSEAVDPEDSDVTYRLRWVRDNAEVDGLTDTWTVPATMRDRLRPLSSLPGPLPGESHPRVDPC
jgi:hypothetical protein